MNIPWEGLPVSERVNYNLRYETPKEVAAVAELSRRQARDTALAEALDQGRCYGMRQLRAELIQQKSLNRLLQSKALAAPSW